MMKPALSFALLALLSGPLLAAGNASQPANGQSPDQEGRIQSMGKSAGRIASQPARDVGVAKTGIPPALQQAWDAPYALKGIRTCRDLSRAFHDLTDVMGPDFKPGEVKKENKAGKLAEAGGKTIVNSIIPFRGLVREVTGAAPAQRRLERAVAAGYARRGFLRGVHQARGCRTKLF
ncbi:MULTISPECIES: hypothetical protein [unclassified Sphingomonas]|uniref:hypothetical protein n=1 Tax=unclassified Sphingomonas TaxID=196159 RepID=UPI0006F8B077|nr:MULTISPECIES: hypothetical protein [unclassified Sphingomonas]KQX24820.1 hypothetical protein ASD17_24180 [Sphingomonas sp. Root1294]KQY69808.1 hypothetical protein ASD39_24295 [Sphingomonas sp. Root50]KRB93922.1 hypothetical protein ASE22_24685 [Sphingomonas sp. Root720]